jgi:hypothetical protein
MTSYFKRNYYLLFYYYVELMVRTLLFLSIALFAMFRGPPKM